MVKLYHWTRSIGWLGEFGDEQVDVVLHGVLLAAQGFFGEGVREEAAVAAVVGVVGCEDVGVAGRGAPGAVDAPVFGEGRLACAAVAVDGLPCVGCGEGDVGGGVADGRAVLVVEGFELGGPGAAHEVVEVWQVRDGVEFGAGYFCKGVEEGLVRAPQEEVEDKRLVIL